MITFDAAFDCAIADYTSYLNNRLSTLKKYVDSHTFTCSELFDMVTHEFYYYIGIIKSFDIIFPDEFIKRDVLFMRLEKLYNDFESEVRKYYVVVSSNEVKQ